MWKENERNSQSRDTNNVDTSNVNTVDDFDDLDTEQENVPIEGAQGQEVRSQCAQTCFYMHACKNYFSNLATPCYIVYARVSVSACIYQRARECA